MKPQVRLYTAEEIRKLVACVKRVRASDVSSLKAKLGNAKDSFTRSMLKSRLERAESELSNLRRFAD